MSSFDTVADKYAQGSSFPLTPAKYLFKHVKELNVGMKSDTRLALTMSGVVPRDIDDVEGLQTSDYSVYQLVEKTDLLFKLIDLENIKTSRVGYVPQDGIVSPAYIRAVATRPDVNSRYYFWYYYSAYLHNIFNGMGAGVRQTLGSQELLDAYVPVPPPFKQERIANFLDEQTARIDALIAEKEALAASLKDIAEVTAYDLVTRGIHRDVARTAHREEWLWEAPAHWGLQKLRQLATIGNGSTPKRDNESYWSGGQIPWLNSGAINATRITEASDLVTPAALEECHLPMVRAGSTVVALTGQGKTRGAASITETETTINQHLAYVSLFDARMSDDYLWVFLTGMYSVLRYLSDGEGSTKGALTCEQLNQLRVLVPPPDEQREMVLAYRERVTAVEDLRKHATTHLDRLREYRSSLISAAVTGQLDLSTFKAAA